MLPEWEYVLVAAGPKIGIIGTFGAGAFASPHKVREDFVDV